MTKKQILQYPTELVPVTRADVEAWATRHGFDDNGNCEDLGKGIKIDDTGCVLYCMEIRPSGFDGFDWEWIAYPSLQANLRITSDDALICIDGIGNVLWKEF